MPGSCLDLFAALLRVGAYPVVRGLWALLARHGGPRDSEERRESGEWREERGRAADNKLTG